MSVMSWVHILVWFTHHGVTTVQLIICLFICADAGKKPALKRCFGKTWWRISSPWWTESQWSFLDSLRPLHPGSSPLVWFEKELKWESRKKFKFLTNQGNPIKDSPRLVTYCSFSPSIINQLWHHHPLEGAIYLWDNTTGWSSCGFCSRGHDGSKRQGQQRDAA